MTTDRDEQIRRRAHQIWESEGRPHAGDEEHWRRAREEIEGEAGASGTEAAQMTSLSGSSPIPSSLLPHLDQSAAAAPRVRPQP